MTYLILERIQEFENIPASRRKLRELRIEELNEMRQQNVLTIATGRSIFLKLAENLARSFYYWNKESSIKFYIATDQPNKIASDVKKFIHIITLKDNEYGKGFSTKLHLNKLAPEGKTLFIDSDCLIFGSVQKIFDKFSGHAISVVGNYIYEGEWFGNVAEICNLFNIHKLPKFNGGIYYIEKGSITDAVYENALNLEKRYDEIGFIRLRNSPNDEVLMSLAMELNDQVPIHDDGSIISDPQACKGKYTLDIIKGYTQLINPPPPHPLHQDWYPHHIVHPTIVHFLGYYTSHYQYLINSYRLKKALLGKLNVFTNIFGYVVIQYRLQFNIFLKNLFRPIFRSIFGVRKIKASKRI